jgi:hypothetical protein
MHPFIHIPSRQVGYRPLPSQSFICVPSKPSFPFCFTMAHTVETFMYSPLDLGKHEIRLLRLQPRQFSSSGEIECELHQVNLDTEPYYEALSYEWGPPTNSPPGSPLMESCTRCETISQTHFGIYGSNTNLECCGSMRSASIRMI